jgi:hypothetical protein
MRLAAIIFLGSAIGFATGTLKVKKLSLGPVPCALLLNWLVGPPHFVAEGSLFGHTRSLLDRDAGGEQDIDGRPVTGERQRDSFPRPRPELEW